MGVTEEHTHVMADAEAAAVIRKQFPHLARLRIVRLGEGTDHCAFDVGGHYVFRFPKTAEAAGALAVEARLTSWLAPQLPLAIPCYRFFGEPSDSFPRPFAGYAKHTGVPALLVDSDATALPIIGHSIGNFLRALHEVDVAAAVALGLSANDDLMLEEWSTDALADLRFSSERGHIESAVRADWERSLATLPSTNGLSRRVVHGDFAAEHVLIGAHGAPTAIIDWSDASSGDTALDIAGVIHWGGERLLSLVLETYGAIDNAVLERARWFAACRAFADIVFGESHQRREYVLAGKRALSSLRDDPWLTG